MSCSSQDSPHPSPSNPTPSVFQNQNTLKWCATGTCQSWSALQIPNWKKVSNPLPNRKEMTNWNFWRSSIVSRLLNQSTEDAAQTPALVIGMPARSSANGFPGKDRSQRPPEQECGSDPLQSVLVPNQPSL